MTVSAAPIFLATASLRTETEELVIKEDVEPAVVVEEDEHELSSLGRARRLLLATGWE